MIDGYGPLGAAPDYDLIELPYKWGPRTYQVPLWSYLKGGGKRAVLNGHRRMGKDDVFLHHTACAAHERIGNYWYLLPEYNQCRKAMWDAVNPRTGMKRMDEAFPRGIRLTTRENEMMIAFQNGSTFQLVGSDNFHSLVGSPPVGLVFSEFSRSNPSAWAYLQPIIEENGGWAAFNSTPLGNNHFKGICDMAQNEPGWFYQKLTNDETGVYSKEQLQVILRQLQAIHGEEYGLALWMQEYFCSFDAAILGSIWGEAIQKMIHEGRICNVPYVHGYPVYTAWDLGFTDDVVILFYQFMGRKIRIFDYHESNHKDIPFYGRLLKEKQDLYGLTYECHWLPHDARARTLPAGGKAIRQQLIDQNVGRTAIAKRLDHEEGIQAARATFPYVWIDAKRCEFGIEAWKNYHHEWDEIKKVFT